MATALALSLLICLLRSSQPRTPRKGDLGCLDSMWFWDGGGWWLVCLDLGGSLTGLDFGFGGGADFILGFGGGLVGGPIPGLVGGTILGFGGGLVGGPISGLVGGPISGLVGGTISGLVGGTISSPGLDEVWVWTKMEIQGWFSFSTISITHFTLFPDCCFV
ncbi:hypothetical protein LWI28_008055 [Acer negundo]|uniref:Uncharacterized protein n=1 Tax=Acer negundo TaxID=4023 RepID=A0AAD5J3I4_ACENE|nr:hypothetical protein LWI28_008055 [Acer negundo]